ncbi:hypothetical protein [Domibacillus mangrovi]|uniref:Uncharacterized protein n=1 Tax=Domibacillus mangrovi TaxID=1714354 RepID=A0A1Q5P2N6_9BACI|nr:hypothetical protein [Domibacillus mangrovi]OKL36433.1 hypothetical protein BLL40_11135 [Domibacillus mangrovi]
MAVGIFVVEEEPKKADMIIVLSGAGRLEKATDLYKERYAEYVLLSVKSVSILLILVERLPFSLLKTVLIKFTNRGRMERTGACIGKHRC